jgi:hypothetical protein
MAYETWEGSAELTGYSVAEPETPESRYPIRGGRVDDVTGERVDFEISMPTPTKMPGPLQSFMYKQEIKLQVTAEPARVQDLALETTLEQADMLAFVANRRVQVTLGLLHSSSPPSGNTEGRSMIFMRRFKGPQELTRVNVGHLDHIAAQIGDTENERGRRIARALRWLRRANLADDEIEEFAALMMGFDGLKLLLPQPPGEAKGRKKGKGKKTASKPGVNATLKHWAVRRCGMPDEAWKQVWDLRNALFHGDLTDNADTRAKLAVAIPNLRLALSLALKHLLKLPENAPPYLELPPFVITDLQITGPAFTPDPQPPDDGPADYSGPDQRS